jgi:putative transposase
MIALMGKEDEMKRRHHTPEQIGRKLREADRLMGEGSSMVKVCKHLEVTEQTYYRWRNQYARDESR